MSMGYFLNKAGKKCTCPFCKNKFEVRLIARLSENIIVEPAHSGIRRVPTGIYIGGSPVCREEFGTIPASYYQLYYTFMFIICLNCEYAYKISKISRIDYGEIKSTSHGRYLVAKTMSMLRKIRKTTFSKFIERKYGRFLEHSELRNSGFQPTLYIPVTYEEIINDKRATKATFHYPGNSAETDAVFDTFRCFS